MYIFESSSMLQALISRLTDTRSKLSSIDGHVRKTTRLFTIKTTTIRQLQQDIICVNIYIREKDLLRDNNMDDCKRT